MSVHPPRFRFSLLALFVLMTLSCVALAWWVQPTRYVAETLFLINAVQPQALADPHPTFDAHEFEMLLNTQRDLLRSDFVIMAAIRDPKIASLPVVKSQQDPVEWIRERLEVGTSVSSQVLTIRIRCYEHETGDVVQILDALAEAYENEVVFEDDQRAKIGRESLYNSYSKIQEDTAKQFKELQALKSDGSQDLDRKLIQIEIDTNVALLREINRHLEIHDLNAVAPSRIRLIQKAISRPE